MISEAITPEALEALSKAAKDLSYKLGPFKFSVTRCEDYSGEHREWKEEFTLPVGALLTEQIILEALRTGQLIPAPSVEKEPSSVLVAGFRKAGFMMTEPHRVGEYRARKLVIGFENPDDADDMLSIIGKALKDAD